MDQVSIVGERLANVITDVQPDLQASGWPGNPDSPSTSWTTSRAFAYMGFNTPLMLKGLARISQGGSYLDIYACHLTVSQFPRIDSLIDAIVRNATPGGKIQQSAKCR